MTKVSSPFFFKPPSTIAIHNKSNMVDFIHI
jgi:hypothetical protein